MAIYLDEYMMGADSNVVAFPHLLVCMGVVCVTDDKLFGIHLVNPTETKEATSAFATWLHGQGVKGDAIRTLYGAANLEVRYGDGSGATLRNRWEQEMVQIAGVLSFSGKARGFDASVIAPKDGFYAEFQADHVRHKCKILYKRNEKMTYTSMVKGEGVLPPIFKVNPGGTTSVVPPDVYPVNLATVNAAVKGTGSNKSLIHEVDWTLRLMKIVV